MTAQDLYDLLLTTGYEVAYDHFAEGSNPTLPFIVYKFPSSANMSADNSVYKQILNVTVELYSDVKDIQAEQALESVLSQFAWDKYELFIEEEKLFQQSYQFSIEHES